MISCIMQHKLKPKLEHKEVLPPLSVEYTPTRPTPNRPPTTLPYTHVLARTVLIICCSPDEAQGQETLSTLKFGECAKHVTTFASANVVAAPDEVAAQLAELRAEVVHLKRQVCFVLFWYVFLLVFFFSVGGGNTAAQH